MNAQRLNPKQPDMNQAASQFPQVTNRKESLLVRLEMVSSGVSGWGFIGFVHLFGLRFIGFKVYFGLMDLKGLRSLCFQKHP